jgi:thiol-disulfide isomerase/thioredoxin
MDTGLFNASANEDVTRKAEPMIFKNADGELLTTESLKGKIVFINFWASWCPPCLAEMPSIQKLFDHYRNDSRIVFIMADADNKVVESTSFLRKRSIELPVYSTHSDIDPSLYKGNTSYYTNP